MTCLRIAFLARRYQATPWEHHVNEGLVEWPPSPWRVLRALLATGYTKLGWGVGGPPNTATQLVERLCSVLPEYSLPPTAQAHTRHYMPLGEHDKGEAKTTKVLDTFALVDDPASFLWIRWPLDLSADEFALFQQLAEKLGYLGRAESWVDARAFAECPPEVVFNVVPPERDRSSRGELIELLCPETPSAYLAWRNAACEGALMQLAASGKKPSAKQQRNLLERFPKTIVDALCTDTGLIQKHGWSRAPGARWLQFRMRAPEAARPAGARYGATESASFVMLALCSETERGHVRPVFSRALEVGLLAHRAVIARAHALGLEVTPELQGKANGQLLRGHRHVHYLPLDLDNDWRIDHILAWCPAGFTGTSVEALQQLRHLYDSDTELRLLTTPVSLGGDAEFRAQLPDVPLIGRARTWVSWTPFVCPRFVKVRGSNTLEGQVRAELEERGLPAPERVEVWSEEEVRARRLHRFDRVRPRRPPPFARPFGLTLHFKEDVRGPLALGYGSHYGLGLFVPAH